MDTTLTVQRNLLSYTTSVAAMKIVYMSATIYLTSVTLSIVQESFVKVPVCIQLY
jgi:hypothetical protein